MSLQIGLKSEGANLGGGNCESTGEKSGIIFGGQGLGPLDFKIVF